MASLWPVADVGTQVLMREFYNRRKQNPKMSKAEALRQAQLALLRGAKGRALSGSRGPQAKDQSFKPDPNHPFAHPYYWASFILIGNWK